jgi:imidazole glycerol-phosphate synthase subunit HisH
MCLKIFCSVYLYKWNIFQVIAVGYLGRILIFLKVANIDSCVFDIIRPDSVRIIPYSRGVKVCKTERKVAGKKRYIMITIIDYGMGNLGSIKNMLNKIGVQSNISSDPSTIRCAEKLILPGVGAFDNGLINLESNGLTSILYEKVVMEKTPILGICLGMQLMTKSSEEGILPGLGWIDAKTVRFEFSNTKNHRVPNIGWNRLHIKRNHPLLEGVVEDSRFYFVHSYHVLCASSTDILTTTPYGIDFISSFAKENIIGVQFHPEKSLKFGFRVLQNFAKLL